MLYRLFHLVANHSIHGNIFRNLDDVLRSSTRHMKATQTNAEESERDTEQGNVSQLSHLQNVRVRTIVPRLTKAAFYASLLFSDSEASRSAPQQLGSQAGLSRSAAWQPGREAGVQPGGQLRQDSADWSPGDRRARSVLSRRNCPGVR